MGSSFDAFVGSQREIWVSEEGSGLIRESGGPVSFFTDEGRAQWQAAGSPSLEYGRSIDLFAPGCLGGSRARRARMRRDPAGLHAALIKYVTHLHEVEELLGEGVVAADLARATHDAASRLEGVGVVHEVGDQLGRIGTGLVEAYRGERVELIFACDRSELLGYRHVLVEPQWFARAGTLHSWSSYLERAVIDDLPQAFGLSYWLMDGGGPLARSKQPVDFAFTQHLNPGLAAPDWRPVFLDYLHLGFTNATAFSPTDVLPLTHRAKYTMLVQSTRCSSTRRTGRRPSRQRVQVGARCPCTAAGGNFASARRWLPRLEPLPSESATPPNFPYSASGVSSITSRPAPRGWASQRCKSYVSCIRPQAADRSPRGPRGFPGMAGEVHRGVVADGRSYSGHPAGLTMR